MSEGESKDYAARSSQHLRRGATKTRTPTNWPGSCGVLTTAFIAWLCVHVHGKTKRNVNIIVGKHYNTPETSLSNLFKWPRNLPWQPSLAERGVCARVG